MSSGQPALPLSSTIPPFGITAAQFSLALGGFGIGTGEFASMGLLPYVARSVDVTIPSAGVMISAYALGVVVGAPIIAIACARVSRRLMLVVLMLMFALGNVATALAPTYELVVFARFITGLPHGAYFGLASLAAASLVAPDRRAQAIGQMMLGLSIANVIGVPFATWMGQQFGWRTAFAVVAMIGLMTAALVRVCMNPMPSESGASPLREVSGLASVQLWLTLGIAAIGFGGMFAIYSYITPTLIEVTGISEGSVPFYLALIGAGMIAGSLFGGWLADRGLMRAIGIVLLADLAVLALFPLAAHNPIIVGADLFLVGCVGLALGPALQSRLMDVAVDAQALAASLNHSAFNIANALGARLGGMAIAAGLGWTSTGILGAALAMAGFGVYLCSLFLDRRSTQVA